MGEFVVTLLTGFSNAAALFLVAAGLSIIFGVTRIVNFAHGSFYMLGAYIGYSFVASFGGTAIGFWGAVLLAAIVVGLLGAVMEILLLRRVYKAPELFQLIVTFGVILIVQDVAQWIWGTEDIVSPRAPGLRGSIEVFGRLLPAFDLALITVALLVLGGLWLVFNKTRWGTLVRAATQDRQMVGALGVNQRWLFTGVVFLGCALAGLGGAAQLPKDGASLLMDYGILADAFVVVVVGGMGSIGGAFLAAVIIGMLKTFGILLFPSSTLVMMFLVMAVVLIFRPWGLLGKPELAGQGHGGPPEEPLRGAPVSVRVLGILAVAFLIALPLIHLAAPQAVDEFILVLATDILIFVLFATALHFIMGPGGLVSFGHAAFFGGGAYTAALLVKFLGVPFEVGFWAAPFGAAILALIIGWFCVRLTGVYFAMLTLAFAQIAWAVVFQWGEVTGGDDGILGTWPSAWASSRIAYYYLTAAVVVLGILFMRKVLYAPFGYTMRAGRDSPLRVAAIGIDLRRHQWFSFVLSGAMAGLAGSLFVYSKGSIFPTAMEIGRSFDALLMVLLGGVQSLVGPILGATGLTYLTDILSKSPQPEWLISIVGEWFRGQPYWRFLLGWIIIFITLAFPTGIVGMFQSLWSLLTGRRGTSDGEPEAGSRGGQAEGAK